MPINPNTAPEIPAKAPNEDVKQVEEVAKQSSEGWATPEELREIKSKIEGAIEYQKSDGRLEKWSELLDYLNCKWDRIYTEQDLPYQCNNNTIYSNLQTEIPNLYFQQPEINVSAARPSFMRTVSGKYGPAQVKVDNIQAAKGFGLRINNVIKNIHSFEDQIERGIADALTPYGIWVWKVGIGFETEFDRTLDQKITKTTYWTLRVDPRNVVWDWLAPSVHQRTWTAERVVRRKKLLLNNPLYLKQKIQDVPTKIPDTLKDKIDKSGKKFDPEMIEFFEYHDEETQTIRWIAIDGEPVEIRKPLKKERWIEGSDYVIRFLNIETDSSPYPLSDAEPVIHQAKGRNRINTAAVRHFENWGPTVFVESGFFRDDEAIDEWRRVGNGTNFVRLKNGALSSNKMQILDAPALPSFLLQLDQKHRQDNDETLGITDYQRGNPTKRTATEGTLVNNAANVRISRRRRKIKLAILELVRKLAALIAQHDDEGALLNVQGMLEDRPFVKYLRENYQFDPSNPWLQVSKDMWQGEYDFDFDLEEMVDRPKSVQVQQLLNTVQTISAVPILAQAFAKRVDADKAIDKLFELQGFHIEMLDKDQGAQIPPEFENEMAEKGIEIPPPHPDDDPVLHTYTHLKLEREMQSKLTALLKGAATNDPTAVQAYLQVKRAIEFLQQHVVLHQRAATQQAQLVGGEQSGLPLGQPTNGPSVPAQITPPTPTGAPTENQISQNAGGSFAG